MDSSAAALEEAIGRCQLFAGLTREQVKLVLPCCRTTRVEERAVLFREGDAARWLYVVDEGKVALEMMVARPDGGLTRPATVAVSGPGDAFGWSALVPPHRFTLTARALVPSRLVLLEGAMLREILDGSPEVGYRVMAGLARLLADRLAQARETLTYERGWAMLA